MTFVSFDYTLAMASLRERERMNLISYLISEPPVLSLFNAVSKGQQFNQGDKLTDLSIFSEQLFSMYFIAEMINRNKCKISDTRLYLLTAWSRISKKLLLS